MRAFLDAYNVWIPVGLSLAILGLGIMLGRISKGERG